MSERKPTSAGMYDYALGGTANTAAERRAVDAARRILPEFNDGIWANRGFVQRAVTRMASQWRVEQFLDLGAGLPTQRNTHEVVAEVIPHGRVVYVDNDPHVVARGRRLLPAAGNAAIVEADICDVDAVLSHPETRRLIDIRQPVGVIAAAVVHFIPDERDPWAVIRRYMGAVPSGSCLGLCALTSDRQAETVVDRMLRTLMFIRFHLRTRAEMTRFFDGLDIVAPYPGGPAEVVHAGLWGAEDLEAANDDGSHWFYAAVARKP
ncbi:MAG: SAM-dependent methyltransferase [Micromonosporaceae bacterium]|nr:SAM-dependent methyltransferase [Micromonosporaceae bacterium]